MNNKKLHSHPAFVAVIAVFCTMLWGSAFPCIKIGYRLFDIAEHDVPSMLLFAGARFLPAGILVLLIGLLRHPRKMLLTRRDLLPVMSLGLVQTYLQYLLLYAGIVSVSGTKSSVLTSVSAFGSVLMASVFFRGDRLTLRKAAGCLIGVAGIFVMNAGSALGGFLLLGDGLVILSNLSGAAGNIISKKIAPHRNPLQLSAWQLIFGGSGLVLTGLLSGGRLSCQDGRGLLLLLYLASMAGTAFLLWTMLLFHNPVSRVTVYLLLIPVFGALWSALFLGENIFTFPNLCALLLVCSGIFLCNFAGHLPGKKNSRQTE